MFEIEPLWYHRCDTTYKRSCDCDCSQCAGKKQAVIDRIYLNLKTCLAKSKDNHWEHMLHLHNGLSHAVTSQTLCLKLEVNE
jgi:hypothetical protein